MMMFPWLQPVVQRAESGARLHRAGDQRDARRAGQPPERCGEYYGMETRCRESHSIAGPREKSEYGSSSTV